VRVNALIEALEIEEPIGALDRPALDLAAIEYPDLDPEPYVALLDNLARRVAARMNASTGPAFVEAAAEVLFNEFGLTGNQTDYYNPRNSFLNDVLDRHTGIPITLSVIYMEIARRLGRPVYGLSLPGHFMVRYEDGDYSAYIDPFSAGRTVDRRQCVEIARSITSVDISGDENAFAPATTRGILVRMLNNLRTIYIHREQWDKLLPVLDLLIRALPGRAEDHKQRGVAMAQLGHLQRAAAEFKLYLDLAPAAADRGQVARQLQAIQAVLARLN